MAGAFGQFTVPRMAKFRASRSSIQDHPGPGFPFVLRRTEPRCGIRPPPPSEPGHANHRKSRNGTAGRMSRLPATAPGIADLGRLKFRQRREVFGIRADDRRRHLAVIGKTGMGKTTLLQQLIVSDIRAGRGLALVDPHGGLADGILGAHPQAADQQRRHVFDAGTGSSLGITTRWHAISPSNGRLSLLASSRLYETHGESWGPRMEHILRNGLLALLEIPGASLLFLQRLLADGGYRRMIVGQLQDPVVKSFWEGGICRLETAIPSRGRGSNSEQDRQFLSHPVLRAIIGQSRGSLDLRRVMDAGAILLINLSKGKIGEDGSNLLGSLLVTGVQLAAMSRANVTEQDRRDFFLYVDEFQNFATESFATILSEARKYRLNLTIANQYLAQMDERTLEAVFGNVGSLQVFQVARRMPSDWRTSWGAI